MEPYYRKDTHGLLGIQQPPDEVVLSIAHGVMIIAAADGELSTAERDELVGMLLALGVAPTLVDRLRDFNPVGKNIEDFIPPAFSPFARSFIYDAVKVARIDGYAEQERQAVRRVGKILGVTEEVIAQIEGLLDVEASLRTFRIQLLRGVRA